MAPSGLLISIAVGLGVPLVAAMLPLWVGTKLTVREAMTSYGVSNGKQGTSWSRIGQRLTWVPQTAWLGMRGIFRKRGRAILTLLALTLSGISFLSAQIASTSFDQFPNQLLVRYQFDATVSTKPQPYAQIKALLLAVPNVAELSALRALLA